MSPTDPLIPAASRQEPGRRRQPPDDIGWYSDDDRSAQADADSFPRRHALHTAEWSCLLPAHRLPASADAVPDYGGRIETGTYPRHGARCAGSRSLADATSPP